MRRVKSPKQRKRASKSDEDAIINSHSDLCEIDEYIGEILKGLWGISPSGAQRLDKVNLLMFRRALASVWASMQELRQVDSYELPGGMFSN